MPSRSLPFHVLFENAAIGIIITDASGTIVMVNDFALAQFGYKEEELIGQRVEQLMPQRFRGTHVHHRENYTHGPAHSRPMGQGLDLMARHRDGQEFPVEVSLSSHRNGEDQWVVSFISDISVRKASEDALNQLNQRLEQEVASRTQSLESALAKEKDLGELKLRFLTMASHQFRTPLSTILSSAYLLAQYQKEEEQAKRNRHVARIVSSVNTLTDILNDFLSVGRMEEGKIQVNIQEIDLAPWMEEGIAELATITRKEQALNYSHTGHAMVLADPNLFKHIVLNLVSNAIKFSPEGEAIEVQTEASPTTLILRVADKGIGISESDLRQLFQRFFRGANASNIQGTGLGLHIVMKYAELMGGNVTVESSLEEGSTFTVSIPQPPNIKTTI